MLQNVIFKLVKILLNNNNSSPFKSASPSAVGHRSTHSLLIRSDILLFHQIPHLRSLSLDRYRKKDPNTYFTSHIFQHLSSISHAPTLFRSLSLSRSRSSALVLFRFLVFLLYLPLTFRDTFFFAPCSSSHANNHLFFRMSTTSLRLITHSIIHPRLRVFLDFTFPLHQLRNTVGVHRTVFLL